MSFNPAEFTEPTGNVSKMLDLGTHFATVTGVRLEVGKNNPDGYNVVVGLEGPDMGDEFQGFDIDRNNQAMGKHRGQIADVRNGSWPFSTYTFQGREILRDTSVFNYASNLAKQLGRMDALVASKKTAETIEDYVELVNEFCVGATGLFTIAGETYTKADGKTGTSRYFPKPDNKQYPFAAAGSPEDKPEHFQWYEEAKHLIKRDGGDSSSSTGTTSASGATHQPAPQPVNGFGGAAPASAPATGGPKLPSL